MNELSPVLQAALKARRNGVSTLPVELPSKQPPKGVRWKWRQTRLPDEQTIREDFAGSNGNAGLAIIGGRVSGNIEILDFDLEGMVYPEWVSLVEAEAPGLINRLSIQQTRSGGFHVISRCREIITPGNLKLAHKRIEVDSPGEHENNGKKLKALLHGGKWFIYPTLIETRGEGGYAVAAPSPGYVVIQIPESGDFFDFPEISAAEREALINCAKALDEKPPENVIDGTKKIGAIANGLRPGEDFNRRGNVIETLLLSGWKRAGGNTKRQQLTRPGKEKGISATLYDGRTLHVFSSNAPPFEMDKSYSAFAIYSLLEHSGDYTEAARALAGQGYGGPALKEPQMTENPSAGGEQPPNNSECFLEPLTDSDPDSTDQYEWLIPDLVPKGEPMAIVGKGASGKSSLALEFSARIMESDQAACVVYICAEGTHRDTKIKARKMGLNRLERLFFLKRENGGTAFKLSKHKDLKLVTETISGEIKSGKKIDFVVIDSIRGMHKGSLNEDAVGEAIQNINAELCGRLGITVCYIHHGRKNDKDVATIDSFQGSVSIANSIRYGLFIRKKTKRLREIEVAKSNLGNDGIFFRAELGKDNRIIIERIGTMGGDIDEADETQLDRAEEIILAALGAGEEVPAFMIYKRGEEAGISAVTMKKAKKMRNIESFQRAKKWFWRLPNSGMVNRNV